MPWSIKSSPNGEISPNLVTLQTNFKRDASIGSRHPTFDGHTDARRRRRHRRTGNRVVLRLGVGAAAADVERASPDDRHRAVPVPEKDL